ncbi:unnamed protein product, partial [Discosporangium mesarthrocarpum]
RTRDALFLLLSGVHVRNGTTSETCVRALTHLVADRDFFAGDLALGAGAALGQGLAPVSIRTLLDYTVEALCDSLDHVTESRFPSALRFLEALISKSEARLGPLVLHRTFRGLSFLCAFATSSRVWVNAKEEGHREPFRQSDPAYKALCELLRGVCRQV